MSTTKSTISTEGLTTFGARLRHARDAQELSRPGLSKLTNRLVSPRVIDHLENGTTDVTALRAEALSNALNIDRNWLMFGDAVATKDQTGSPAGEPVIQPVDTPAIPPVKPVDEPQNTPKSTIEQPEKALSSALKRSKALGETECKIEKETKAIPNDIIVQFPNSMRSLLSQIDQLRKAGLQNHPRKLPKMLARAVDIGECLELNDLREFAKERKIRTNNLANDLVSQNELDEFVLRLIDTALLGIDLYELDLGEMKAFAEKVEVDSPFFGWKDLARLIPNIRDAHWKKALEGDIRLTTALHHTM